MANTKYSRTRPKYFSKRFSLGLSAWQYDVGANYNLFKSANKGASSAYDATDGMGDGYRYNVTIKPETNPIWVQFNSTDNDYIYVAGDATYEEYNLTVKDLFITPADATTAQIDRIVFVAESAGNYESGGFGTYFKLFAQDNTTGAVTTYGVWFDTDAASTIPVDAAVDTWLEVDITGSDTAATIAAAAEVVIDGVTGIFTSDDGTPGTLDVTHTSLGSRKDAEDVNTPCTVSTPTDGEGVATTVNVKVI